MEKVTEVVNASSEEQIEVDHIDYDKIPLRALHASCRRQLSLALLQERLLPTSSGLARDWQGLCELAGFDYHLIQFFRSKSDPVAEMLEFWSKQQPSVAELVEALKIMERFDILEDIGPMIEKDALAWIRKKEKEGRKMDVVKSTEEDILRQLSTTSSVGIPLSTPTDGEDNSDKYAAYVSYIDSDADFVAKMIAEMEVNYKLRLFIKGRDIWPGVIESEADLCLINEKCEKILLIVSQESLTNSHCEFHEIVAQAAAVDTGNSLYARKVIPIICKPCVLPPRFKYLARLDYTKKDLFNGFWRRLYWSIKGQMPDGYTPTTGGYTMNSSPDSTIMNNTGPLLNFRPLTSSEILIPHEMISSSKSPLNSKRKFLSFSGFTKSILTPHEGPKDTSNCLLELQAISLIAPNDSGCTINSSPDSTTIKVVVNPSGEEDKVGHIDYTRVPLRALNVPCRRMLSLALRRELLPTSSGLARDWQGLCELAGFEYDLIRDFQSKPDPVVDMLELWWERQQPSVAELLDYLEIMERYDMLEDITHMIEKDALTWIKRNE